jgi:hypothetical protein
MATFMLISLIIVAIFSLLAILCGVLITVVLAIMHLLDREWIPTTLWSLACVSLVWALGFPYSALYSGLTRLFS